MNRRSFLITCLAVTSAAVVSGCGAGRVTRVRGVPGGSGMRSGGRSSSPYGVSNRRGNNTAGSAGTNSLGRPNVVPRVATANQIPATGPVSRGTVTSRELNIRIGPGTQYNAIGRYQQDDVIDLIARNDAGDWLLTPQGWVSRRYVRVSNLNISAGSLTVAQYREGTSRIYGPYVSFESDEHIRENGRTNWAPRHGIRATVTAGRLNVRHGPGPSYGIHITITQGDTVTLTGRNSDASWVETTIGWINAGYIRPDGLIGSLPITE